MPNVIKLWWNIAECGHFSGKKLICSQSHAHACIGIKALPLALQSSEEVHVLVQGALRLGDGVVEGSSFTSKRTISNDTNRTCADPKMLSSLFQAFIPGTINQHRIRWIPYRNCCFMRVTSIYSTCHSRLLWTSGFPAVRSLWSMGHQAFTQ